jgi:RNA polymerase sigma-70 factor (ECF subfamily)
MVDERNEEERVEAAFANPDEESAGWLETIYRDGATAVLQTAYRVTGNADDAQDVLQTVFARLANRDRPPDFSTGSRAYLRRAATNAALDIVQSKYARNGVSLEVIGEDIGHDPGPGPDRQHHGRQLQQQLRQALSKISRRGAEIFALRYFEGMDNAEIAKQLGTSTNTVAVTLHRTRALLKEEMGQFMGGLQ